MDVAAAPRRAGLLVAAPRPAACAAADAAPRTTADGVVTVVRHVLGAGLLQRIEPAGSPVRYPTRTGDDHHHVVCRTPGATGDGDGATG